MANAKRKLTTDELRSLGLDESRLPKHVAIIMDGNGRWAKARGLSRTAGHRAGMERIKGIIRFSSDAGIDVLSLYAFSTENWKRPKYEVTGLMALLVEFLQREIAELNEEGVRIHIIGDWEKLPARVCREIENALALTADNTGLVANIALNYGSRAELLRAVSGLCADIRAGIADADALTLADIEARLYTAGLPDPDLIIRTSGEKRLSNFMLYQAAYSEMVFTDTLWPDFDEKAYTNALRDFASRERRFGGA